MLHLALARLREPSTYAGLATLLGLVGLQLAPEILAPLVQLATGAAGLAAVLLAEKR